MALGLYPPAGGVANIVLAYDPTDALTRAAATSDGIAALSPPAESEFTMFAPGLDAIWTILTALDQQPDAARLTAARDQFLSMVADNRSFWAAVAAETDNDAEWLPNDGQTSAFGLTLPPGTGATWLAVLTDGEALLKGEKLVPYWRTGDARG